MSTSINNIPADYSTEIVSGNIKSAMKSVDAKSRDLWFVPTNSLTILEDFNVRSKNDEYTQQVRAIADSIKTNGFYSHKPFAVIVTKQDGQDVLAVYDGHTRYEGLQLAITEGAQVERVPVVAAPAGTTLEDITVGLVTNNSGNRLEPLAIGIVCKRLVGYGLDVQEIGKRLGYTPAYVGGLLTLVGAPKQIRDMVSEGKVSASLAVNVIRDHAENAVTVLLNGLETAVTNGKTKVTAKVITKKPAKVLAETNPEKNPIIKGLEWIRANGDDEKSYELLSIVTGFTVEELKKF